MTAGKLNISIDDVSPHPQSGLRVLDRCYELLARFPSIRFSLFVPAAYWRTVGPTATPGPLLLDHHPAFCDALRTLSRDTFELCYHGLFHGVPGVSNNDEFQHLGYDDALGVIDDMTMVVTNAGLFDAFQRVLRPPAWRMSPGAIRAAIDRGFTLALSRDSYAMATYGDAWKDARVVWQTCNPPILPLQLDPSGMTEAVFHACEWDRNFLSVPAAEELAAFIGGLGPDVRFSSIEALCGHLEASTDGQV